MFHKLINRFKRKTPQITEDIRKDVENPRNSELGSRATAENSVKYIYSRFFADYALRATILEIRNMDATDGRVKRIHSRTARDAVKGGLILECGDKTVRDAWAQFSRRCKLNNNMKLRSDARGLFMEGSLPYQWVYNRNMRNIVAGLRMPSDSIVPNVGKNGRFYDPAKAYRQVDLMTGEKIAEFGLFQMTMGRMDPDSYDDHGSMGRPYLDASRVAWRKLTMTEEDLVLRRRTRAAQRTAHLLKGMGEKDVEKYIKRNEADMKSITTDFYVTGDGGDVKAIAGDANLDQIADVSHLLDTFFAGAPAPRGLFGYTDGLSRDVLEDLKRDYYEEVDSLQDNLAEVYIQGFEIELLLQGINPLQHEIKLSFAERRTETPNQTTDRALKWQALGMPSDKIYRMLGENPEDIRELLDVQSNRNDPYPQDIDSSVAGQPTVNVTPGNGRKGDSATTITTR